VSAAQLPLWVAGSHITLHLPNGLKRQYSLCGDPAERGTYQIAVLRAHESRGGSEWLHTQLRVGDSIDVSGPHNHFELEPSPSYTFIAGGIGITPIKAMIESLPARREWSLLYTGRSRSSMAFAQELELAYPGRVTVHADDVAGGPPHIGRYLFGRNGQVYVCGPERLLAAVADLVPEDRLHFERFAAVARDEDAPASPVEVTMARSRQTFTVEPGTSMLDAINKHGGAVVSSCGEGVCGTCEVRVLSGEPWHRDSAATDADKDELSVMYPCVSWSRTTTLTLDI
jgi:ferredoxin-NADP reductase